jgi:hypothetical protein
MKNLANEIQAHLKRFEAGPVWHLTRTPGRPWCASDYHSLAQTDIEANANCPACAEAKKQPAPTKNNHVA